MDRLAIGSLVLLWASQVVSAAERPTDPPPSPQQIHRLIEALGDADYFARQKAESDLGKIGFDALEAVTAATEHDDMEIALRANRLLSAIRSNWSLPGESADVGQLLAEYESQDDDGREARVVRLVNLPEDQGIPAVCRIICYERSLLVAKRAALRLLEARGGEAPKPELAATLQKGLGTCRRAPARWVLAWLQARQEPQAIAKLWTQLAAEEEGLLLRQPRDTSLPIVEDLLQFQIVALRKIDRGADAAGSVERWIKLRRGEPDELARLLNWLIDQKDWPATRIVEKRCQAMIAESADLLYLIAEAQVRRGDAAAAEQSAGRALKLESRRRRVVAGSAFSGGKQTSNSAAGSIGRPANGSTSSTLLRRTPRSASPPRAPWPNCTTTAKETIGLPKRWAASRRPMPNGPTSGPSWTATRKTAMNWTWELCGHAGTISRPATGRPTGDRAKQRECLDKALATQSYDIEVLIECYQIPDSPADYRAKIRQLIEKRLCELREQVGRPWRQSCRGRALQRVCLAGGQHRGRSRRSPAALETLARSGRRARRLQRHARPSLFRQGRLCRGGEASNPRRRVVALHPCRAEAACAVPQDGRGERDQSRGNRQDRETRAHDQKGSAPD